MAAALNSGRSGRCTILFTRFPEPGRTKTRLVPVLGAEGAAELQRRMTEHMLRVLREFATVGDGCALDVRFAGGNVPRMQFWLGCDVACRPQGGGDLGRRMARAFQDAFDAGHGSAVIVGSDCPGIAPQLVRTAFDVLGRCDLVLGPAEDGGYYLIGMQRFLPEVFEGISWGTDRVLAETLERGRRHGLSWELLPRLADVDRPEDLAVWEEVCGPDADLSLRPSISVIIPTLDEAQSIRGVVQRARAGRGVDVTVVDGGSTDGTADLARKAGARVLHTRAHRAAQMNLGARHASGEILLFLHADTLLPHAYDSHVRQAFGRPGVAAGAFAFGIDGPGRMLRRIERTTNARSRYLGMPYGDQGLFMTARTFRQVGGFPEIPIMDDYELVRRLRRIGRVVTVGPASLTSARRWLRLGPLRTTLINQTMIAGHHLGVPLSRLAQWYHRW